jgi:hypothetical protein
MSPWIWSCAWASLHISLWFSLFICLSISPYALLGVSSHTSVCGSWRADCVTQRMGSTTWDIVSADLSRFSAHVSLCACTCLWDYFLSLLVCCNKSLVQSRFEWACVSQHVYVYMHSCYDCGGLLMSVHIAA